LPMGVATTYKVDNLPPFIRKIHLLLQTEVHTKTG
jgi:hypothetical protein